MNHMTEPQRAQRRLVKCHQSFGGPPFYWVEEWWTACNCPDCRAPGHWRFLAHFKSSEEQDARDTANHPVNMYEEIQRQV